MQAVLKKGSPDLFIKGNSEDKLMAAPKASAKPVNLGTKRACPKCAAKFYDFGKMELDCPKCGYEIDVTKLSHTPPPPVKSAPVAREVEAADTEVTPSAEAGEFESLDDLESDDEPIGVDTSDDSDDDNY
jgi:uncharacterized protein (TIGR02300 family)